MTVAGGGPWPPGQEPGEPGERRRRGRHRSEPDDEWPGGGEPPAAPPDRGGGRAVPRRDGGEQAEPWAGRGDQVDRSSTGWVGPGPGGGVGPEWAAQDPYRRSPGQHRGDGQVGQGGPGRGGWPPGWGGDSAGQPYGWAAGGHRPGGRVDAGEAVRGMEAAPQVYRPEGSAGPGGWAAGRDREVVPVDPVTGGAAGAAGVVGYGDTEYVAGFGAVEDDPAGYGGDGRVGRRGGGPQVSGPRASHPSRAVARRRARRRRLLEWPFLVAFSLVAAVLIRLFVMQTFFIPSPSMHPTLVEHDRVLVNKLSYRLHDVHRGDVVVFRRPPNLHVDDDDLIKRVIGLPGDTVEARGRKVYVNGRLLREPYVPAGCNGTEDFLRVAVPSDHVFVMGDNRCDSTDSRVFGPISVDLLVGRAFVRWWPPGRFGWL